MQHAGAASWRFAEGTDQLPSVALYVRDAARLTPPADASMPPPLKPAVPGRVDVLDGRQRTAAGEQWLGWWHALLAHSVRGHRAIPDGADHRAWLRARADEGQGLFDPPQFDSFARRPELRAACHAVFDDALRWTDAHLRGGAQFDHGLIRGVAEDVARARAVDIGALDACAVVVPVEGAWWRSFAPGAVVCSVTAASDPRVARTALTAAFESGLDV